MRRWLPVCCAAVAIASLAPSPAAAQSDWPAVDLTSSPQGFPYGPGFYLSITKIAISWGLFLLWVYTTEFVNISAQRNKFPYTRWNAICFFPFLVALLLTWVIPIFWLSLPLLILAYAIPLGMYVRFYNREVPPHEQVMTAAHLRYWIASRLAPLGVKIEAERKSIDELIPVKLEARGTGDKVRDGANLLQARESDAFHLTRELLLEAFQRRSDSMMMDFTKEAVAVRYLIDGMWTNGAAQDRPTGDAMLAVMKTIAALKPAERRARQEGEFGATHESSKYTCHLTTQGTKTGERALLRFDDGTVRFEQLPDLGMREKMVEQVREYLARQEGFILISAPPGNGLTALFDAALGSSDRYMRDYRAVEDQRHPEREIENVGAVTYDSASGETPASVLPQMLLKHPDVIICRDLANLDTLNILCDQASGRLVLTSIRAKDTVEALARVLAMKVDPARFAEAISCSLSGRLVRRLCEACKEAYVPPPQLLQKLGLPPGRVESLYRPPQQPEEVCGECGGIGYRGRTGIFEFLPVGDVLRKHLAQPAKLDVLRKAARKDGLRTLQEEGLLLVVKGVTSLPELMRVLKE